MEAINSKVQNQVDIPYYISEREAPPSGHLYQLKVNYFIHSQIMDEVSI